MLIAKNYIYNLIYQLVTLIVPLITIPYVSRVLGSEGIGINAYTNSIIQYFILFGTLGISLYGNRQIAYARDNKHDLYRTFWGIFTLKISTTFIAYVLYLIFLLFVGEYHSIFLIQSLLLIAAGLDISWLFMGLEDFKKTVIRNILVKITGLICVFLLVENSADLWVYVLILSLTQLLGHLSLWLYLPRAIKRVKLKRNDILKHLVPSITLFVPQIAIQIYIVLNKTMLGILSDISEVGIFDNADKIVKVVLSIVTAIGVVLLPRISNTYAKGEIEQVKNYIYKSFNFTSYISFPLMFGMAAISIEFAPWFFGSEFNKTGILIAIISPIIIFIAWSNVLGYQYMMSTGKIKAFTISVIVGAMINFIINLILIPRFNSIGAAIATVIAEFSVITVQLYLVRKDFQIKKLFESTWKYFISGVALFFVVRVIGLQVEINIMMVLVEIIFGGLTYVLFLLVFKSEMNNKIFQYFKKLTRM